VVHGISHMSCSVCLESTKIVFEMWSLANVSPQTIASCSVVHFSSDTVPWKCLIDSWCQNAVDCWSLPMSRFAIYSYAVVVMVVYVVYQLEKCVSKSSNSIFYLSDI